MTGVQTCALPIFVGQGLVRFYPDAEAGKAQRELEAATSASADPLAPRPPSGGGEKKTA